MSEPTQSPEVLTIPQAAERLGVTEHWLREAVRARRVQHTRLGRNIRFSTQDIADIVAAGRIEPADDKAKPLAPSRQRRHAS